MSEARVRAAWRDAAAANAAAGTGGGGGAAADAVLVALPPETAGRLRLASTRMSPTTGAWAHALHGPTATLGRGLENTVTVADPLVSRQHATLALTPDGWRVTNASRRQPLWVGGVELASGESHPLAPGAVLRLGNTRLRFLAPPDHLGNGAAEVGSPMMIGATGPARGRPSGLLGPGITLQYALAGRSRSALWWGVALALVGLLAVALALTAPLLAWLGDSALLAGGPRHLLAAVALPLVPAAGAMGVVLLTDRYEREPWSLLLAAFVWGAVIAIPLALLAERALVAALGALPIFGGMPNATLAGGITQTVLTGAAEEAVKGAGLVVLALALRDQFDNVTDGIVYGVMVGAGFAVVENVAYFALSPTHDLPWLVVGRVLLGWLGHSTFTAIFGAALGAAREAHRRSAYLPAAAVGLLAAAALHALFDTLLVTGQTLADDGVSPAGVSRAAAFFLAYLSLFLAEAALARLLVAALEREAAVLRAYLADEVLAGAVLPGEYVLVQDARRRARAERAVLARLGPRAYLRARALHQALAGLAVRKWHVAQGDRVKASARQPEEAYRRRIAALRARLAAAEAAGVPLHP